VNAPRKATSHSEKAELKRIAAIMDKLGYRCAEAYQIVGSLGAYAGLGENRAVIKAMDLLCDPLRPGKLLPFYTPKDREPVRPQKAKSSSRTVPAKGRKRSGK
jgi:hypothetical protein